MEWDTTDYTASAVGHGLDNDLIGFYTKESRVTRGGYGNFLPKTSGQLLSGSSEEWTPVSKFFSTGGSLYFGAHDPNVIYTSASLNSGTEVVCHYTLQVEGYTDLEEPTEPYFIQFALATSALPPTEEIYTQTVTTNNSSTINTDYWEYFIIGSLSTIVDNGGLIDYNIISAGEIDTTWDYDKVFTISVTTPPQSLRGGGKEGLDPVYIYLVFREDLPAVEGLEIPKQYNTRLLSANLTVLSGSIDTSNGPFAAPLS